jgi:L-threonylcarbamoyladenylate synthase
LYARLREADRLAVDVLLAVPPPDAGVGAAVRDRLRRAAGRGSA